MARIEGMKAANAERAIVVGDAPIYVQSNFDAVIDEECIGTTAVGTRLSVPY